MFWENEIIQNKDKSLGRGAEEMGESAEIKHFLSCDLIWFDLVSKFKHSLQVWRVSWLWLKSYLNIQLVHILLTILHHGDHGEWFYKWFLSKMLSLNSYLSFKRHCLGSNSLSRKTCCWALKESVKSWFTLIAAFIKAQGAVRIHSNTHRLSLFCPVKWHSSEKHTSTVFKVNEWIPPPLNRALWTAIIGWLVLWTQRFDRWALSIQLSTTLASFFSCLIGSRLVVFRAVW